jgi:hypothetical protein
MSLRVLALVYFSHLIASPLMGAGIAQSCCALSSLAHIMANPEFRGPGPSEVFEASQTSGKEVAAYGQNFSLYCRVNPGLTGLWQVSGRNAVSSRDQSKRPFSGL